MIEVLVILLGTAVWIGCGVLAYQYTRAYYRWEFPILYATDPVGRDETLRRRALVSALFGPLAIPAVLINGLTKHDRKW